MSRCISSEPTLDALIAVVTEQFRPILATLGFCGLRVSEALGLKWGDVDLTAGTLHVHRQLGRDGRTLSPLKTATSEAVLSIPGPLLVILREHRDRIARRHGLGALAADRLVFVTRSGRSPGRRNVLRAVQNAAEKLGIEGADGQPLGCHDLRHSCAGLLRDAGLSDGEISLVLRHATARDDDHAVRRSLGRCPSRGSSARGGGAGLERRHHEQRTYGVRALWPSGG